MQKLFSKNVCLSTKINLRLKKTQKVFGGSFKNVFISFVFAIKKLLVIHFPYMEIVWLAFFLTKCFCFLLSTIHRTYCQNKRKVVRKFNDTILAQRMKFV